MNGLNVFGQSASHKFQLGYPANSEKDFFFLVLFLYSKKAKMKTMKYTEFSTITRILCKLKTSTVPKLKGLGHAILGNFSTDQINGHRIN